MPDSGTPLKPLAIYIHWPWCKAKCPYCDFNSHASEIHEDSYVDGLLSELAGWRDGKVAGGRQTPPFTPRTRQISSVFFGGGTPSLMTPGNLAKIITACRELGVMDDATEITVECNPTSFDDKRNAADFFTDLKAAGVNRVSIGVQGLKQEWLTFLGRTHRVGDAITTLEEALKVFDNVNADVIYGLPGQSLDEWLTQLEKLTELGLTHISAYQLTIEPNTAFFRDVRRGRWEPISVDLEADFFEATRATLLAAGYENYEISNFAKPGKACRHNVHVWQYGEYVGVGAGAHGRVVTEGETVVATAVVRQPEGYLRRLKDLTDTLSVTDVLSGPETVQEAIFSGLRLATGVDVESLIKHFGMAIYKEAVLARETAILVEGGLLEVVEGHLRLTTIGWPRLNGVLQRILPPLGTSDTSLPSDDTPPPNAYNNGLTVTIL